MSKNPIKGRTALVTGANRGIGLAVTKALLNAGVSRVYAGARRTETLAALVDEFGDRVVPVELDVTNDAQVLAAAGKAKDVDLLINNAGVAIQEKQAFVGDGGWIEDGKREMDTNVLGTYRMTQAFAPALKANGGGTVANVVSIAGFTNFSGLASYSMSKAALHSLTQASRALLADQGTEVLGIYPGPIDTAMAEGFEIDKATPESAAEAMGARPKRSSPASRRAPRRSSPIPRRSRWAGSTRRTPRQWSGR